MATFKPTVVETKPGCWIFVGSGIPAHLRFESYTQEQLDIAKHCGPGFAKLKTRSWTTKQAALEAGLQWFGFNQRV